MHVVCSDFLVADDDRDVGHLTAVTLQGVLEFPPLGTAGGVLQHRLILCDVAFDGLRRRTTDAVRKSKQRMWNWVKTSSGITV